MQNVCPGWVNFCGRWKRSWHAVCTTCQKERGAPLPMNKKVEIGRLAMRHENDLWVAYYALTSTMKDAIFLGSIRMGIITRDPARQDIFMNLMRDAVADIIEEKAGSVQPSVECKLHLNTNAAGTTDAISARVRSGGGA